MRKRFWFGMLGLLTFIALLTGCAKKEHYIIYKGGPLTVDSFQTRIMALDVDTVSGNVALGFADSLAVVWNPQKREVLNEFYFHHHIINDLAFSPDGKLLVLASGDERLSVNNAVTGKFIDSIALYNGAVTKVAFSYDGRFLAAGFTNSEVDIFELPDMSIFGTFNEHTNVVTEVAFSPNNYELYTAGRDSLFFIMDVEDSLSFKSKQTYGYLDAIAISSDAKYFAQGGTNKMVKVWQWKDENLIPVGWFSRDIAKINDIAFYPTNNKIIVACDQAGQVIFLKHSEPVDSSQKGLETGGVFRLAVLELGRFKAHDKAVRSCAFSRDASKLYTCSDDGTLKTWDVKKILADFKKKGSFLHTEKDLKVSVKKTS